MKTYEIIRDNDGKLVDIQPVQNIYPASDAGRKLGFEYVQVVGGRVVQTFTDNQIVLGGNPSTLSHGLFGLGL